MLLRKAKEDDFPVFKSLYVDSSLHWLYASENENPTPEQEAEAMETIYRLGCDPSFFQEIENQYLKYSEEEYFSDLNRKDIELLLIESGSILVGYVIALKLNGKVQVLEWAMICKHFDVIKSTLKLLKLQFLGKNLQVNVTNNYAKLLLEKLGFKTEDGFKWEKLLL